MAVFVCGSAYADEPVDTIIPDYLAEFHRNVNETLGDVENISFDLRQCFNDFEDCMDPPGIGEDPNVVQCLNDFIPCVRKEGDDKDRTCTDFLREFRGDYRRALRDARQANVKDEFEQDPAVQNTVVIALGIASMCY